MWTHKGLAGVFTMSGFSLDRRIHLSDLINKAHSEEPDKERERQADAVIGILEGSVALDVQWRRIKGSVAH